MNAQQFAAKWLGKRIDYDHKFKFQCVDLVAQYVHEVFGLKPGAWGDAINWWNNPNPALLTKFYKVSGGMPLSGDIVILHPTEGNSEGHIAVMVDSHTMLEQNGSLDPANNGLGGDAIRLRALPLDRVAGFLRPINTREEAMYKQKYADLVKRFNDLDHSHRQAVALSTARQKQVETLTKQVAELKSEMNKANQSMADVQAKLTEAQAKHQEPVVVEPDPITFKPAVQPEPAKTNYLVRFLASLFTRK